MTSEKIATDNTAPENIPAAVNLLDLSQQALADFFVSIGEPAFRAVQWIKWVHQLGVTDYSAMTNFSNALRQKLMAMTVIKFPEIAYEHISVDGTRKWLIRLYDGQCIETVFIPEKNRGTLCVSSQVGCVVNCDFCSTARQGFNRNLSIGEIIGQVWLAVRRLSANGTSRGHEVRNVVMMGMGEPLLNFEPVVAAMELMLEDNAYNLSKYRVTLSTSGIVPKMLELAKRLPVALAVSLHAPNDALRDQLVPINKKYPLTELMGVCRRYFELEPRRHITFEYVLLDGINDSESLARELVKLLKGMEVKLNLIPFNPFPQTNYQRSRPEAIERFRKILLNAGINTIIRKTRGDDIDAACGQLVGRVQDRSHRQAQYQVITQRIMPEKHIDGGRAQ